ncbi:MAG: membrane protein insertase YidC [Candidatus Cloacimonetes bacterium]|nr:membrane protein insertase YidC [Candidatus Cloacimonadota bacterium]
MDKKTLLAVLLILVVFWISSEFIWKKKKPIQQTQQQTTEKALDISNQTAKTSIPAEQILENENEIIILDDNIDINNNIVLENELIRISFSNQGAVINSIQLKEFFMNDKESFVELVNENGKILNTKLNDTAGNISNYSTVPFQYEINEAGRKITFISNTEKGTYKKIFILSDDYEIFMETQFNGFENLSSYEIDFGSGIADTEEYLKMKNREYAVISQIDNDYNKIALSKLKEERRVSGSIDWAAVRSKYFTMAIMPNELIEMNKLSAYKFDESPTMKLSVSTIGSQINHKYNLYMGPLDYGRLKEYNNGIENIVEMGPKFLQPISKIFHWFLSFLYGFIPSWGLVIIIFSIILKTLLYPLTHKSFESTTKMQKIQPLTKELQAKYKGDPQKMNVELKKLYKEHGVNPLGGCLPMLLQMPVIFALYPLLRYSISLRQASFGWLPDLSEPDPIWALPILMAVFMFVQQKLMAPSKASLDGMDDKQKAQQQSQKMMMYFMPIMMFFIFKGLSSGLVLYWTVFSIIGSAQQYFIKKKFM